ncbi:LamG domain-containing protein [bacterium]
MLIRFIYVLIVFSVVLIGSLLFGVSLLTSFCKKKITNYPKIVMLISFILGLFFINYFAIITNHLIHSILFSLILTFTAIILIFFITNNVQKKVKFLLNVLQKNIFFVLGTLVVVSLFITLICIPSSMSNEAVNDKIYYYFSGAPERTGGFILKSRNVPLVHTGIKQIAKDNYILNKGVLQFDNAFVIQCVLKPAPLQVDFADIVSNHKDFYGITIEKDNKESNYYTFFYGDGLKWYVSKHFQLKSDTWNYLVIIFNEAYTRIYLNASLISAQKTLGNLVNSASDFYIGNWFGHNRKFNGEIREVLIYNGEITEQEIVNNWAIIKRKFLIDESKG